LSRIFAMVACGLLALGSRSVAESVVSAPVVSVPIASASLEIQPITGPYGVGTLTQVLTDSSRPETISTTPDDYRKVALRLWYPTAATDTTVPYFSGALALRLAKIHLAGLDVQGDLDPDIKAHGREGATVAPGAEPFPLLVFPPGWGVPAVFYRDFIEDIVSHGYVVAAIDHPYFSGLTVFPDGTAAFSIEMEVLADGNLVPKAEQPKGIAVPDDFSQTYLKEILVPDVGFVVDYLDGLPPSHALYGRLDASRFGMYGQSLGGIIAVEAAKVLPGCQAVLNIDGWSTDLNLPLHDPEVPLFF
jgi:dienelactone hydrolase